MSEPKLGDPSQGEVSSVRSADDVLDARAEPPPEMGTGFKRAPIEQEWRCRACGSIPDATFNSNHRI